MNHGACNLDPNQSAFPWLPGHRRTVPGRYNGDERRPFLAGQRYQPSSCCLSPGKQMLGADLVPSRHLGNNRSREIGLRDDPALLFLGPTAPAPNASPDFYTATRPRTVKYIVDHICEPISPNRSTSTDLSKSPQGAVKRPLTVVAEVGVINIGFDAGDNLSNLVIVPHLPATNEAISIEWHEAGTRATCDIGDVGRRLSLRVHIIVAGEFKPGVDAPVKARPRKQAGGHRS